jgi:hypothetical protein
MKVILRQGARRVTRSSSLDIPRTYQLQQNSNLNSWRVHRDRQKEKFAHAHVQVSRGFSMRIVGGRARIFRSCNPYVGQRSHIRGRRFRKG